VTSNPTSAPCPICGPAEACGCMTAEERAKYPNLAMIEGVQHATQNPLTVYQNRIDEERQKVAARDAKIARLEKLYDSSLKTIADRDTLIKHLRERYDWLRDVAESVSGAIDVTEPQAYAELKAALREPTP